MQQLFLYQLGACLFGAICVGVLAWSLRSFFERKLESDVAWLTRTREIFTPQPGNARRFVVIAYVIHLAVVLPLLVLLFPEPIIGVILWLSAWLVPQRVAEMLWVRRLDKIDRQLPVYIRMFSSCCAAGLSMEDALHKLAEEADYPIRYEFRIMAREWDFGQDLTSITESAAKRIPTESFRLFAAVIEINNQLGGNLVETLEALATSIANQYEMKREINAELMEGKMSTYGLLMGPPVMLGIVTLIDRKAVDEFFTQPLGIVIFIVAMIMIVFGYLWARSIANIKV